MFARQKWFHPNIYPFSSRHQQQDVFRAGIRRLGDFLNYFHPQIPKSRPIIGNFVGLLNSFKWTILVIIIFLLGSLLIRFASTLNSAPPTIKIGLVAPFEGLYRSTGYEALFAVKLALQERNQRNGLNGYRVELVALNDFNNPDEARRQARSLVADPDIVGVVGHMASGSTLAALPVYRQADLALVIPWSVDEVAFDANYQNLVTVAASTNYANAQLETMIREMGINQVENVEADAPRPNGSALQFTTDAVTGGNIILNLNQKRVLFGQVDVGNQQLVQVAGTAADGLIFVSPGPAADDLNNAGTFILAYQSLAGLPPGPRAILAYDATNILLDSIEQAMIKREQEWGIHRPNRAEISSIVTTVQHNGLTGNISFDTHGQRLNAPVWLYQITEARYPGTLVVP